MKEILYQQFLPIYIFQLIDPIKYSWILFWYFSCVKHLLATNYKLHCTVQMNWVTWVWVTWVLMKYFQSKGAEMATRMEEILMTGNQLEYCKALDNYVLNRSERLPLPIGMVFNPKYFQHLKGLVWLGVEVPFQTRKTAPPSGQN